MPFFRRHGDGTDGADSGTAEIDGVGAYQLVGCFEESPKDDNIWRGGKKVRRKGNEKRLISIRREGVRFSRRTKVVILVKGREKQSAG